MRSAGERLARDARAWLDLELQLGLDGTEERRRPGLRAHRDRLRPLLHDRQLVRARVAPDPARPDRDLAALDAYYRDAGAPEWSWVGLDDDLGRSWARALAPARVAVERSLLLAVPATLGAWPPTVVRVEGERDRARLEALVGELAGAASRAAAHQALELHRRRDGGGRATCFLGAEEGGELVGWATMTAVGERCWLEDLETRPECRRRGHGLALLEAALVAAGRLGARWAGCRAVVDDWPADWYRREGFRAVGQVLRLRRRLAPAPRGGEVPRPAEAALR